MIPTNTEQVINQLIEQGRTFAAWRIPGEDRLHFRMRRDGSCRLLHDIKALNGLSGFVVAPFQATPEHPITLIEPDCLEFPSEQEEMVRERNNLAPEPKKSGGEPIGIRSLAEEKRVYTERFERFTRPLSRGIQDKLVLSRETRMRRPPRFSPGKAFLAAVTRYTRSYIYICHTPETGTWMGSTPEILLSGGTGQWHTVALAGTQSLPGGELPQSWDQKNWREQQLVAAYIRRQLRTLGIRAEEKGPYSVRAGEVAHLKSDFYFALPEADRLGDLLRLLHPTPAVCGLPKEEAYRFILENEGYDRGYYSGFVGWLDPQGQTDLYVNLRCMRLHAETCALYAGGGLLADSHLEEEWQETEYKLDTMRRLFF